MALVVRRACDRNLMQGVMPVEFAVVYETLFGCTRQVANSVAEGLQAAAPGARVRCVCAADAAAPPAGMDLLVVGGPTHFLGMASPRSRRMASEHQELLTKAGRIHRAVPLQAGPGVREWLAALPHPAAATPAAAFDTRLTDLFPGSAARLIADSLRDHGYQLAARPEGFLVEAYEGPLCEGERERARMWGLALASHLRSAGQVCLHQR